MDAYEYACRLASPQPRSYHDAAAAAVEQGLSRLGFKVVSFSEFSAFPPQKRARTLLYRVTPRDDYEANASVYLEFYDQDRERLFTFTGKVAAGGYSSSAGRVALAAEAALAEVGSCYSGYSPAAAAAVAGQWDNWEKVRRAREELVAYFDANAARLDPVEGIWTSAHTNQYQLAIFRDTLANDRDFVATIMKSEEPEWSEHQVKAEFQKTAYVGTYTTTWYMRNHSKQGATSRVLAGGGMLALTLQNYTSGDTFSSQFIKNYPANVTGSTGGAGPSEGVQGATSGSGFLLSDGGLVATNYHVVANARRIEVLFPDKGRQYDAVVAVQDRGNDLALLRLSQFTRTDISSSPIPYGVARSREAKLGEEVFTLGFPLSTVLGTSAKLSVGAVSSLCGVQDDPRMIQISNPVQPGNSGGPLLDKEGNIVGVVVASLNARYFYEQMDVVPQNVNFAIKAVYLAALLDMLPEGEEGGHRGGKLSGLGMVRQVELISPFVVAVKTQ
jgi:serine protease Do